MCTTTTEEGIYVDFNVDEKYTWADDGLLFDVTSSTDDDHDACCLDAIDAEDFSYMRQACDCDTDVSITDEYYTFDSTLTCTRRFDTTYNCVLKSDATSDTP